MVHLPSLGRHPLAEAEYQGDEATKPAQETVHEGHEGEAGHEGGGNVADQEDGVSGALYCGVKNVDTLILGKDI